MKAQARFEELTKLLTEKEKTNGNPPLLKVSIELELIFNS